MKEHTLTNKQILVLSFISEFISEGLSGKKLNLLIEKRNVRAWTQISFSNVYYILDRLEKLGYLNSKIQANIEKKVGAPEKIYQLTNKGKNELKKVGLQYLTGNDLTTLELNLGLAASYLIHPSKVIQALKKFKKKLEERLVSLERSYQTQGGDALHFQAWGVINLSRYRLETQKELIEELIGRIEIEINTKSI